jgi:hypothetical protein
MLPSCVRSSLEQPWNVWPRDCILPATRGRQGAALRPVQKLRGSRFPLFYGWAFAIIGALSGIHTVEVDTDYRVALTGLMGIQEKVICLVT